MDLKPTLTVDWFIIFTRSRYKFWALKWIEKDFSHVYAMKKSPGGQFWIVVNPLLACLDCELLCVEQYPHPRLFAGDGVIILPVRAITKDVPRWTFCVFNCVEVIKAILGIRAFWVWTPWQLYKYLTRGKHNGGLKNE